MSRQSKTPVNWLIYFLLGIGIVGPAVFVVWLLQATMEAEDLRVMEMLRQSDEQSLRDAEAFLLEQTEGLDEVFLKKGSLVLVEPNDARPSGEEAEAASVSLAQIRRQLESLDPHSAQRQVITFWETEDARLQLSSGRSVAGYVLLLLLDKLESSQPLETEFESAADAFVLNLQSSQADPRFSRYVLSEYATFTESERVRTTAEHMRVLSRWLEEEGVSTLRERGGRYRFENHYIVYSDNGTSILVIQAEAWADACQLLLSSRGNQLRLAESGIEDEGVRSKKRMAAPFSSFSVIVDDSELDGRFGSRTLTFVTIGSVVLLLTLLSGIAVVAAVRRQASIAQLKDNLIATVTHELKTPIASTRLLVDTLLDAERREKVDTEEYLQLISRENSRLGRLIENFLSFSRMERQKGSFHFEELKAVEVIDASVRAFRERFEQAEFVLRTEISDETLLVRGDREALETVLANLLENALKYSRKNCLITVRLSQEDRNCVFEVADEGIGIAKKDQKRIFQKFHRVDHEQVGNTGSVGLGLSIVDFIVKMHQGSVAIESEFGKGSVFKIVIPHA